MDKFTSINLKQDGIEIIPDRMRIKHPLYELNRVIYYYKTLDENIPDEHKKINVRENLALLKTYTKNYNSIIALYNQKTGNNLPLLQFITERLDRVLYDVAAKKEKSTFLIEATILIGKAIDEISANATYNLEKIVKELKK